jgi:ankyrin repeat protein
VVPKESALTNLANEVQFPRESNHHAVCKFGSTKDPGYGEIIGTMTEIVSSRLYSISTEESACLADLNTSHYESHRALIEPAIKGTCEWILKHGIFKQWLDDTKTHSLWLSGGPGCGKSVMTSFLIQKLERNAVDANCPISICYFFFDDKVETQRHAHYALCAILHQILSHQPSLARHAITAFQRNGPQMVKDLRNLWNTLLNVLSDPSAGTTMIVLDAADECEQFSCHKLLQWIVELMEDTPPGLEKLKFLITSRPEFTIQSDLRSSKILQLRLEDEIDSIDSDISTVVSKKLDGLGYSDEVSSGIMTTLMSNADGTFLWVSLVLRLLEESGDSSYDGVLQVLNGSRGNDLHNIYAEILSRIPNRRQLEAIRVLQIVATTSRPLTLREFNIALAISTTESSIDRIVGRLQHDLPRFLLKLCGPFIRIRSDQVHLVHQTAKDFLLKSSLSSGKVFWKLERNVSNSILAEACLWYLTYAIPSSGRYSSSLMDKLEQGKNDNDNDTFLEYSAMNWATHFREGQSKLSPLALQFADKAHNTSTALFKTWMPYYWTASGFTGDPPKQMTTIMSTAITGHDVVINSLQTSTAAKFDLGATDSTNSTALLWACRAGHLSTVKLLIDLKNDIINVPDQGRRTPLWWAAWNGNAPIVELLLVHSTVNLNSPDARRRTPLLVAAWNGHEDCVKLLLCYAGVAVDKPDSDGSTPLAKAASRGHKSICRIFLEHENVNTEVKDKDGRSPLARAAQGGHVDVLRLLLENSSPASTDKFQRTPLSLAAEAGHLSIVKALLRDPRVDPDSRD